jgi:PEP-CTERM motif
VKTLRLAATVAALILGASAAPAAVMDVGNVLGPSGGYTTQAYYRSMLGGQSMTAGQQAYADLEDQLRQSGFRANLGGDFALGQMFYQIAYDMAPPSPWVGGGSGPSSFTPGDLAGGSLGASAAGGLFAGSSDGSVLTVAAPPDLGGVSVIAAPEASTWAMMLLGFGGLGYAGWRGSRNAALALGRSAKRPARHNF